MTSWWEARQSASTCRPPSHYEATGRIMTALLCVLAVTAGGKDALVFDNTMHDYGDLLVSHGAQSCRFEFVNVSDSVVCILGALTSCNCTTVDYPREAIEPGQGGAVVVTYDPVGRPEGEFERTVLLILNGESVALSCASRAMLSMTQPHSCSSSNCH